MTCEKRGVYGSWDEVVLWDEVAFGLAECEACAKAPRTRGGHQTTASATQASFRSQGRCPPSRPIELETAGELLTAASACFGKRQREQGEPGAEKRCDGWGSSMSPSSPPCPPQPGLLHPNQESVHIARPRAGCARCSARSPNAGWAGRRWVSGNKGGRRSYNFYADGVKADPQSRGLVRAAVRVCNGKSS